MSPNTSFLALIAFWLVFGAIVAVEQDASNKNDENTSEMAKIFQILSANRILEENGFGNEL